MKKQFFYIILLTSIAMQAAPSEPAAVAAVQACPVPATEFTLLKEASDAEGGPINVKVTADSIELKDAIGTLTFTKTDKGFEYYGKGKLGEVRGTGDAEKGEFKGTFMGYPIKFVYKVDGDGSLIVVLDVLGKGGYDGDEHKIPFAGKLLRFFLMEESSEAVAAVLKNVLSELLTTQEGPAKKPVSLPEIPVTLDSAARPIATGLTGQAVTAAVTPGQTARLASVGTAAN